MTVNENRHPAVQPRRIRFNYPVAALDRHFVQGDLVMSHMIAHLSAVFPEGEDFFIRSVRRYADQITDPDLKDQVKGFIGQEVTHGREHRALNERLHEMGYPTRRIDRLVARRQKVIERRFSPLTCLSITAALEHFTAVFAETLLSDERAQALLGTTEVRSMLLWHAIEESEHRSVAFDVYRAVGGDETRRIKTMRIIRFSFPLAVVANTIISLLGDRAAYHPVRLIRSFAALRHSPFLTRAVFRRLGEYMQPGFHPDDHDNTALLERWEAELFGEQGTLVDHLH
ncbi:metal-dependent hydrolase [Mycolicibacter heraklionensis]|uniref:Metal-dependent hydrolase n=1 Tax=Mycolicibacter heraklionensis TaxID=512402 RepID=A0A9X7WDX7_9MYCO|nr:metal-dependent hydrolase [Mycolicibacter heraklionensis]KLO28830.1 metal-dependent hydrolase [Mycolicibacter heraklionensis]QZA06433.1 metal-dependent hydrolase [Mycolicibacter heraklionensis]